MSMQAVYILSVYNNLLYIHCLSPMRPNLQGIFMCIVREIKVSCDKGADIPYITHVYVQVD